MLESITRSMGGPRRIRRGGGPEVIVGTRSIPLWHTQANGRALKMREQHNTAKKAYYETSAATFPDFRQHREKRYA